MTGLSTLDLLGTPVDRVWRRRVRTVVGLAFTILGTAGWAVWLTVYGRASEVRYDEWNATPIAQRRFGGEWVTDVVVWGADVRWAAMVLAIGGLVLLAVRSWSRLGRFALLAVGWFVADLLLDRFDVSGWTGAVVVATVVGWVIVVAMLGPRPERPDARLGYLPFVYSGAALAVANLVFLYGQELPADAVPAIGTAMARCLAPLLVIAATAVALLATDPVDRPRVVVGQAVAATAIAVTASIFVVDRAEKIDSWPRVYGSAGASLAALLALALVVAVPSGRVSGWAYPFWVVLLVIGGLPAAAAATIGGLFLFNPMQTATGHPHLDSGFLFVLAGCVIGAALGATCLVLGWPAASASARPPAVRAVSPAGSAS